MQKEENCELKKRQQKAKKREKKNLKHAKKGESKTLLIKKFHCKMMGR